MLLMSVLIPVIHWLRSAHARTVALKGMMFNGASYRASGGGCGCLMPSVGHEYSFTLVHSVWGTPVQHPLFTLSLASSSFTHYQRMKGMNAICE